MKKVLLLCGSPRPNGNTYQVLEECAGVIEDEGLEAEIISMVSKDIKSCLHCKKCFELKECIINDGLNNIITKIRESEGFIVGSPVYYGTARGDVMSALQRIGMVSLSNENFLSWKVGGPIAVARRGGHTSTIQEMLMFFLYNDMIVPGSNSWNMVFGWAPGDVQNDKAGMDGVHDALVQAIKIPDYDRFQRIYELDEANFEYPETKTDNVTLIEITMFQGRSLEAYENLRFSRQRN